MTISGSKSWSDAHLIVRDRLVQLTKLLNDHGYDSRDELTYDRYAGRMAVNASITAQDTDVAKAYDAYCAACDIRDGAIEVIQAQPKEDLGF